MRMVVGVMGLHLPPGTGRLGDGSRCPTGCSQARAQNAARRDAEKTLIAGSSGPTGRPAPGPAALPRQVARPYGEGVDPVGEPAGHPIREGAMTATASWPNSPSSAPPCEELGPLYAWWPAANYLSVGQISLMDYPLLRQPLQREHVKPRLLGHWGSSPGLTFLYAHANRAIR